MLQRKNNGFGNDKEMLNEISSMRFIPYTAQIEPSIVTMNNGEYLAVVKLEGVISSIHDEENINKLNDYLNTALKAICDSRLSLWHHAIKSKVIPEAYGVVPSNNYAKEFFDDYQNQLNNRNHYVIEHYFTFVFKSHLASAVGFFDYFSELLGRKNSTNSISNNRLDEFKVLIKRFLNYTSDYNPRLLGSKTVSGNVISEPLSFLFRLINVYPRDIPINDKIIKSYIATTRPIFKKGFGVLIHHSKPTKYFSTLSIKERLGTETSSIDINDIYSIDCEFVLTHTFEFEQSKDAIDEISKKQRELINTGSKAISDLIELDSALDDVATRKAVFGYSTLDLTVYCDSQDDITRCLDEADTALSRANLVAVRDDIALEAKFWANLPANSRYRTRVVRITSSNFCDYSSMHVEKTIPPSNDYEWGEYVITGTTRRNSPIHLSLHVGDSGETTITGIKGSGKTVLMTSIALAYSKQNAKVIYIDKDRGAHIAILAAGGSYNVIKSGVPTGFNPLQLPDTKSNRFFLNTLLSELLSDDVNPLTTEDKKNIDTVIDSIYFMEKSERIFKNILLMFPHGDSDLRTRFERWINSGAYSWVFDNEIDTVNFNSNYCGFDITEILDSPEIRKPVLTYLSYLIDQQINGQRIAIFIDEGWKALEDNFLASKIKNWELVIRKNNGVVVFGTQQISHLKGTEAGAAIAANTVTQLFGFNPEAPFEDYKSVIDSFSQREYELIKTLKKREFLLRQPEVGVCEIVTFDYSGMDDHLAIISGRMINNKILDRILEEKGYFDKIYFISECKKYGRV